MNWLWQGNNDVVFKTAVERKRGRRKKYALMFIGSGVLVVLLALFFFLLSFDFDIENMINRSGGTVIVEEQEYAIKEVSGEQNFLMFCTDDNDENVTFVCGIKFDMGSKEIKILPVSASDKIFNLNSQKVNATACYKYAGTPQLVSSAEEYFGVTFDKYIGCKEGSIEGVVANFPQLKVNFLNDVTLQKGGDTLSFKAGEHVIEDDEVYKLLTYTYSSRDEFSKGLVVSEMMKQFFSENLIGERDNIYSNVVSQVNTNVSVVDFASYKDYIVVLSSNSVEKDFTIASSVNEFKR